MVNFFSFFFFSFQDINDNVPVFNFASYNYNIAENATLRSSVGEFVVTDLDINAAGRLSVALYGNYSERLASPVYHEIFGSNIPSNVPIHEISIFFNSLTVSFQI